MVRRTAVNKLRKKLSSVKRKIRTLRTPVNTSRKKQLIHLRHERRLIENQIKRAIARKKKIAYRNRSKTFSERISVQPSVNTRKLPTKLVKKLHRMRKKQKDDLHYFRLIQENYFPFLSINDIRE